MMTNLFSIFDPSTNILNLSLNWISTFMIFFFIPFLYWLIPSRINLLWFNIMMILHLEMSNLLMKKKSPGMTLMFISILMFILFNNFLGLFPYIFTGTSHLSMTLTLAFPLWLSMMLFGWINFSQLMFAHMIPQNTPTLLMPLMVCIESISNIIRPGTLSIRLTANMIAGHLLITLLSESGPSMNLIFLIILIMTQILLMILEIAVSIIQSYVFSILSTLYSSEVN
uniref:ATP synthase subunit a n=1 Tax=Pamphilius sp. ZJUH_2016023 TaxID=2491164 RepID=A0A3Q8UA63_9HYME|nr:ATP synthase F0 subunit 6 [Pamphilius sp. ZJUH_2016023]